MFLTQTLTVAVFCATSFILHLYFRTFRRRFCPKPVSQSFSDKQHISSCVGGSVCADEQQMTYLRPLFNLGIILVLRPHYAQITVIANTVHHIIGP